MLRGANNHQPYLAGGGEDGGRLTTPDGVDGFHILLMLVVKVVKGVYDVKKFVI